MLVEFRPPGGWRDMNQGRRRRECQDGNRLRDAYLMALSREDSVRAACSLGEATARELYTAHEQLIAARKRYWAHVQHHKCRSSPMLSP